MSFQTKKLYRGLNGRELKEILVQRVAEAMSLDNTVNVTRGFPLVRYEVKIAIIPYHATGMGKEGRPIDVADGAIVYEVDGEYFVPVDTEAVELVENSPLYGREADPQDLRALAGMGKIETVRASTGELVDVVAKPEPKAAPPPSPVEDPDVTYAVEEQRWAGAHADPLIERATKLALDDPAAARAMAPGRVSIVESRRDR